MRKKAIIFGAGKWGRMAYYYYKDICDIECFVDNSHDLWGQEINGITVCAPQILGQIDLQDVRIIIANKWQREHIFEQLYAQFGISECIFFNMEIVVGEYVAPDKDNDIDDECIISYMGGLGNQMFQYTLAKCFMLNDRCVTGDLSSYYQIGKADFILDSVFPEISIKKCNIALKRQYKKNSNLYVVQSNIQIGDKTKANISVLKAEKGYFEGFWQSAQYARLVEKDLRRDFRFTEKREEKLCRLSKKIIDTENAVSIHIRRGDYLESSVQSHFGNICTDEYYEKAIKYINNNVRTPVFYFFSNDIKWVEKKYSGLNAVFISENMFENYKDWYDMFLMSCCKHNIIANSTFSWWGAWLNPNQNKIVIAPSKWRNDCNLSDICPEDWVRL